MAKQGRRITTFKALEKDLDALGFTITTTGGGHKRVHRPGRPGLVFMAATASDHRSLKNTMRDLRKEFDYEPPDKRST